MISYAFQSGKPTYRLNALILDTFDDMANIGKEHAPGSTAYIVATGQTFMLNNRGAWIQQLGAGSAITPEGNVVSISTVNVDDNNHLIITFSNGTVQDAGEIKVTEVGETTVVSF